MWCQGRRHTVLAAGVTGMACKGSGVRVPSAPPTDRQQPSDLHQQGRLAILLGLVVGGPLVVVMSVGYVGGRRSILMLALPGLVLLLLLWGICTLMGIPGGYGRAAALVAPGR